jgi:hypothetical protein
MRTSISPVQALAGACGFTAWVWRRVWAMQVLAAVGPAVVFVGLFAALDPGRAADLICVGAALTLVTAPPLAGAVLRQRMGGAALRGLGPAGLQFGMLELRLIGAVAGWIVATLLAWLPIVVAVSAILVAFHGVGEVRIRGLGAVPASFLIAGGVVAGAAAAYGYGFIRMLMTLPASVARSRVALAEGWRASAGAEGAVAGGVLFSLAPAALASWAVARLDGLASPQGWAWQDATVVGAAFGILMAFVQAPLTLGVLGAVYLVQEARPCARSTHARRLAPAFSLLQA